jgi:hypothetical protein
MPVVGQKDVCHQVFQPFAQAALRVWYNNPGTIPFQVGLLLQPSVDVIVVNGLLQHLGSKAGAVPTLNRQHVG